MYRPTELAQTAAPPCPAPDKAHGVSTRLLTDESKAEVLAFLAEHPLHTMTLAGLIENNGLESPFNRGQIYGCRNCSERSREWR